MNGHPKPLMRDRPFLTQEGEVMKYAIAIALLILSLSPTIQNRADEGVDPIGTPPDTQDNDPEFIIEPLSIEDEMEVFTLLREGE